MIKFCLGFLVMSLATIASAHTGMDQSSILHDVIHAAPTIGVYIVIALVLIAFGVFLFQTLPKAKLQRIKK